MASNKVDSSRGGEASVRGEGGGGMGQGPPALRVKEITNKITPNKNTFMCNSGKLVLIKLVK